MPYRVIVRVCFPTQSARLVTTLTQAVPTTVRPWVPTVQSVLLDPTRPSTATTTRHRARPATRTKQPWPPEARMSQLVVSIYHLVRSISHPTFISVKSCYIPMRMLSSRMSFVKIH